MKRISGKNVLLTGASKGIGLFIAKNFARQGANLALVARSRNQLNSLRDELKHLCPKVTSIAADLGNKKMLASLPQRALSEFGSVDILVNNAAIEKSVSFDKIGIEEIEKVISINLEAPMALSRAFLPDMLARNSGHIVNVASLAGLTGVAFQETYSATKHGLVGFSRSLRASLDTTGSKVGVSVICPGFVSEAGLHYENLVQTGLTTPKLLGESRPQAVADAVIEAILKNRGEIIVNKIPVRPLFAIAAISPRIHEWIARRLKFNEFFEKQAGLKDSGQRS